MKQHTFYARWETFCISRNVKYFEKITWFNCANHIDGIFWSASKFFFQFYVMFRQKNLIVQPCVYAALPNKKAETYVEMLNAIKTNVKPLGDLINELYFPETSLTDFEMTIQNALREFFP